VSKAPAGKAGNFCHSFNTKDIAIVMIVMKFRYSGPNSCLFFPTIWHLENRNFFFRLENQKKILLLLTQWAKSPKKAV